MGCTIKRRGHEEKFDERKVYGSCYAAGMSGGLNHSQCEDMCSSIAKEIKKWIKGKKCVSSNQIFKKTNVLMKKFNKEAAFMYETHRDIN
jgi:transcriptional regulator NrdR family protein